MSLSTDGAGAAGPVPLRRKLLFWALLTALSVLFVEVVTNSAPFAFFNPWGLLVTCPLYGLHVLVLARIVFLAPRVRLPLLFTAGAILGLYEAYITKVLWDPTWGWRLWTVGGVHVFQTALLLLDAHPFMAFLLPLAVAEVFFTSSREIQVSLPGRLSRALETDQGRRRAMVALALYFGAYHALAAPPTLAVASAAAGTAFALALGWLWRRSCAGAAITLRRLLPSGRQTGALVALLALYYLLTGVFLRPQSIPRTATPHVTILALYAVLFALLWLGLRAARGLAPPAIRAAGPACARGPWAAFAACFVVSSGLLSIAKPMAAVVTIASWVLFCAAGLALLAAAAVQAWHGLPRRR
ncbi:MAG: hypothetical protein IT208_16730 [Chthonomonadales bacterium]|nr:hypothetical protein [Chthonomonadales bacterium]